MIKKTFFLSVISLIAISCNQPATNSSNDSLVNMDSVKTKTDSIISKKDSTVLIGTHLTDTAFISGSEIIFLRPDSLRFESYSKKLNSGISEADSDFGFAFSMALDTILQNKNFKSVKATISTKRYIRILDCKGGPITIDRDTVNFGIVLSAKGKMIVAEHNVYPGELYIHVVRKYFDLKK
ncbi:MAG: hypothetical protein NT084_08110 [Bacteroidetes bacterium]|nr:hypothetical protein [Bacteroidota bacterium]